MQGMKCLIKLDMKMINTISDFNLLFPEIKLTSFKLCFYYIRGAENKSLHQNLQLQ